MRLFPQDLETSLPTESWATRTRATITPLAPRKAREWTEDYALASAASAVVLVSCSSRSACSQSSTSRPAWPPRSQKSSNARLAISRSVGCGDGLTTFIRADRGLDPALVVPLVDFAIHSSERLLMTLANRGLWYKRDLRWPGRGDIGSGGWLRPMLAPTPTFGPVPAVRARRCRRMSSLAANRESTSGRGARPKPTSAVTSATNVHASRGFNPNGRLGCVARSGRPQKSEKYIRSTASPVSADAMTTANPITGNASTAPVDQQLLADESQRAGKARARQAHREKTDRQHRHPLVSAVIRRQIEPSAARFEDEHRSARVRQTPSPPTTTPTARPRAH